MTERILERALIEVLNMSLTASVVILAVFAARLLLKRAPRIFSYALWAVVLFRLLCPVSFSAPLSLLGALRNEAGSGGRMEYIAEDIGYQMNPELHLPAQSINESVNEAVNSALPQGNPAGSVNPMQLILFAAGIVWGLGMAVLMLYSVISLVRLKRRLRGAVRESERIYRFSGKGSPFVCGILRPRIYLPAHLAPQEERYIRLHEEIHIRRRDPLLRALAWLAVMIHWFNPLVWAAFHFSGRDMEMACDEAVIKEMGAGVKKAYSESLLAMASGKGISRGIPLAFGEGDTGSRIRNVLRYRRPKRLLAAGIAAACILLAVWLLANPAKDSQAVYYGVVQYSFLGGTNDLLVEIPRSGGVSIPDAERVTFHTGAEIDSLEAGDLVKITFPRGVIPGILESYPGSFTEDAESIEVMGQGGFRLSYEGADQYLMALPFELAPEAEQGDTLEIWHDGNFGREILASVPVLSVDDVNNNFWIALSTEQTEAFLQEYGLGIECRLVPLTPEEAQSEETIEQAEEPEVLTKELLAGGSVPDGVYQIFIRSISRSLEAVDFYVVDSWDMEEDGPLPALPFVDYCAYLVNQEMNTLRYEAVTFDEFADAVSGGLSRMNVPCTITIQDGLITRAEVDSAWYGDGITYEPFIRDTGYEELQERLGMTGEELLEAYYTLDSTQQADISESRGTETAEIYTGNTGDEDSGLVLLKNRDGELLYSMSAHTSRAGWNSIYLGTDGENDFITTIHAEDRDTYGEYRYQVFRLGAYGQILQAAGSSFSWNLEENSRPNEENLRQWTDGLRQYLENSRLLLSTQDGEIRTSGTSMEMLSLEEYSVLYGK